MPRSERPRPSRRTVLRAGSLASLAFATSTLGGRAGGQTPAAPLKIGVIGSGHIGGTIGSLWVKAGHLVMFSSRHPEELAPLVQGLGDLAKAGTVAEAIAFGDVIFIAVPYGAYPQIGKDYASQLSGKVMLDAGNAVARRDGDIINEVNEEGIGVTSAKYFPGAHIVRAFNTMSYRIFAAEANRAGDRMAIPIAGDDKDALTTASMLVHDAGFDPVVVGPLARAKDFAQGGPLYGQQLTAEEFRKRLEAMK
ncbi:MAG: NADP oxidoreductase [Bradyrhizobium sp.]|uniref:NADPH-dependent F420 reductase n=1 Tax=Bradyrhizobium sp. TaxID=376 RepID=UPI0012086996|nr:NADPH-dependent F420 reductase [Bradyrhizobium sp.]THD70381.1 MAG: NADP oxidoreductase [Bradyrhizobium sp.]